MDQGSQITRVGVIMAGGSGERFWPLSRKLYPKQLLRLTSPDRTMLGEAVERLAPVIPPERVYIITGRHLVDPIRAARIGVPDENVIAEPCKRNTSGALAYAAAFLLANHGGDGAKISMAVTTADHEVQEPDRFQQTVAAVLEAAERDDSLATMGVVPTRPETGYGYIQIDPVAGADFGGIKVCPVTAFHEKPSRERAQGFVDSGDFYWNSGMFFWKISAFLCELDRVRPALASATRDMARAMRDGHQAKAEAIFESLEDVSIDYALMEHAQRVVMARADFHWDDIGAWPALDRTLEHDENGNVTVGDPVVVDCENCIVYNDLGAEAMAVSVVGVKGLVVVATADGLLVLPKDRAQDVRLAVQELKRRDARQL